MAATFEWDWQTIGSVDGALILVVAHTVRGENGDELIRIISARKAMPSERKRYEEGRKLRQSA